MRHEDAPGGQLLRLRRVRLYKRLQLRPSIVRRDFSSPGGVRPVGFAPPER
jgi:hypothetical protein